MTYDIGKIPILSYYFGNSLNQLSLSDTFESVHAICWVHAKNKSRGKNTRHKRTAATKIH